MQDWTSLCDVRMYTVYFLLTKIMLVHQASAILNILCRLHLFFLKCVSRYLFQAVYRVDNVLRVSRSRIARG